MVLIHWWRREDVWTSEWDGDSTGYGGEGKAIRRASAQERLQIFLKILKAVLLKYVVFWTHGVKRFYFELLFVFAHV